MNSPQISPQRVIVISGPPAAGKTTLARPLASALGFALLAKDDIKEAIFGALDGPVGDLAFSRKIGAAAMETLWALAQSCPRVVLEANFRTRDPYERAKFAALPSPVIEINCRIPPEEATRRFAERARSERHHPAHALREISREQLAEYSEPFNLGPVIEVDGTCSVDIPDLIERIRAIWESPAWSSAFGRCPGQGS